MNKVIKRDGTYEAFDPEKIKRVAKASGLEENEAQKVAENVSSWIKLKGKPVNTVDIRNEVVRELQNVNEYAANLYLWYETTKYKNQQ